MNEIEAGLSVVVLIVVLKIHPIGIEFLEINESLISLSVMSTVNALESNGRNSHSVFHERAYAIGDLLCDAFISFCRADLIVDLRRAIKADGHMNAMKIQKLDVLV